VLIHTKPGKLYIGTSGWSYRHWRGIAYPAGLASTEWLAFLEERFNSVEVNSSFYRIPKPEVVRHWVDAAPAGFEFALKMWRGITHYSKLKNAGPNLKRFLDVAEVMPPASRAPMLLQLPPNQSIDLPKLDHFLSEFAAASDRQWRLAVEFRHDSWLEAETLAILDRHGACLCVHDMRGKGAVTEPNQGSTIVYVRRHGSADGRYSGSYAAEQIAEDAQRIGNWRRSGRDVYVYYNNDMGGHAFYNALELRSRCEQDQV
jgi:uncharacterized protein YecE (DUF72 family)